MRGDERLSPLCRFYPELDVVGDLLHTPRGDPSVGGADGERIPKGGIARNHTVCLSERINQQRLDLTQVDRQNT
jgi:hypothetical protein